MYFLNRVPSYFSKYDKAFMEDFQQKRDNAKQILNSATNSFYSGLMNSGLILHYSHLYCKAEILFKISEGISA